jgi:hypothetical protein
MLLVRLEYVILVSCPLGRRPLGIINIIIIITSVAGRQEDTDEEDE